MNINKLKIFCGSKITESDLSKNGKISLLNFVQNEADKYQLMSLILDGKIVRHDNESRTIIEDRFTTSKYPVLVEGFKDLRIRRLKYLIDEDKGILAMHVQEKKNCQGKFKGDKIKTAKCIEKITRSAEKIKARIEKRKAQLKKLTSK